MRSPVAQLAGYEASPRTLFRSAQRKSAARRSLTVVAASRNKSKPRGFGEESTKGQNNDRKEGFGWYEVANRSEFDDGRQIKSVIMPGNKQAIVVYRVDNEVFCSDAESTAFKFPVSNAKVLNSEGSLQIEVPFDGTRYELRTGQVTQWCPQNNPLRFVLGSIKKNTKPIALTMYDASENSDGKIFAKLG